MVKQYYSSKDLVEDTKNLVKQLEHSYDAILVVARGGMSFAHILSQALNIRDIELVNIASYDETVQRESVTIKDIPILDEKKRYLIVEDIVDSGKSMLALIKVLATKYPKLYYDIAAIFYKPTAAYKPRYYLREATMWIDFFWEVDL